MESLASTLIDSQVDLNPHQVDAALFACRNPLSRGVLLADEVGNLRKQWHQELQDKFGLQGLIPKAKSYNAIRKQGQQNPLGHLLTVQHPTST